MSISYHAAREGLAGMLLALAVTVVNAQAPLVATPTEGAMGEMNDFGWGLSGPRGRHYVFGGVAMADYTDSTGQRRIVALQHEAHIQDERHLYYRELRTGHRWAFARTVGTDGRYGVWFQLAAAAAPPAASTPPAIGATAREPASTSSPKTGWLPFQRATLLESGTANRSAIPAGSVAHLEPTCCN